MSDTGRMDPAEFLAARLDEKEARARRSGPGQIAWLTYRDNGGRMLYTTVAANTPEAEDYWCADGKLLPEAASVRVAYDPAQELRDVAADRAILAACSLALSDPVVDHDDTGPWLAGEMLRHLASRWSGHPDYGKISS